jgi:hypothetical protein
MIESDRATIAYPEVVRLHPLEVLETRHTPMFMCCGHWSYTISVGLSGPSFSVTWVEDGDAACNAA